MTTTGPGAVGTRPRWRRWLLAALPWVAAGALGVGGFLARSPAAPPDSQPAPAEAAAGATPPPAARTTPEPTGTVELGGPLELAVLATARATLGTAGLPDGGPAPDRWPLEARVADVRDVGDGLVVVEVQALVIEHTDGDWQAPRPRAVAVPARLDPPAVLGAAWPVAAPVLPLHVPAGSDVGEADPAVVAALATAGWVVDEVVAVELVLGSHLRVTVHGTPPGDDRPARHAVWLRDDPGGPRPLETTDPVTETP